MGRIVRALVAATALTGWACSSTEPGATPQVASVSVSPRTPSVAINAQVPLQAEVRDASGALVPDADVTWTVQDPTIVSVSSAGVVTGLKIGTSQVAANALGKSGIATVTVTNTPVASVVVLPDRVSANVGSTTQLTAKAYDAAQNELPNRTMTWTTSNAAVATVDPNTGVATALLPGTTTITATSGGVSGTATLTAVAVVASVSVSPASPSIAQNNSTTLTATVKDGAGNALSGQTVTWATSDATIASLSASSGQTVSVTGGVTGQATITASSAGKSGTSTVTVTNGTVSSVIVTFAASTIKANDTTTVTAVVLDANQKRLQGRTVSWSATGAATVTPSSSTTSTGANSAATAIVKGKAVSSNSTATITATITGRSGSATLTVTK